MVTAAAASDGVDTVAGERSLLKALKGGIDLGLDYVWKQLGSLTRPWAIVHAPVGDTGQTSALRAAQDQRDCAANRPQARY